MTEPQDGHRVEAVDRALRLLVMLADAGPAGATLAELANRTQIKSPRRTGPWPLSAF